MNRDKKIILLVEDNPDDVNLTLRAFKKHTVNVEVTVVRDGSEALDYLFRQNDYAERHPGMPDVILLDVKLPKVTGIEVLRAIRQNEVTRFIPVVMLTSSTEQEDIINSYTLGANSYIRKPVDYQKFIEAVQQLGIYWLVLNESTTKYGH
jgi:two-component system, response regulator